jgi:dihydroorotate dehydrogenase (fumarate)
MDFTTNYLGMKLRSPLVPSASPLSTSIDNIKKMEDAGAGAVVLYSLFEEQLELDQLEIHYHLMQGTDRFAEAQSFFPEPEELHVGPEGYLDHIQKAKAAVDIPIIASINGISTGGWIEFAKKIEEAGASGLELNVYKIPSDMDMSSADAEQEYIDIVKTVKDTVSIPVAVKIGPYFSNMANMAKRLDEAGADALVLFNRFYQPDIDLEALEVRPNVLLSTPQAMRLPLRWIAILHGRINADMAATSGIHTAADAIKMLMVGANVTMMASALLRHGIDHLKTVEQDMRAWLEEQEYESVQQLRGSLSQKKSADPSAFERAQYMRAISSYDYIFKG